MDERTTCWKCGRTGLVWEEVDGWVILVEEIQGKIHFCNREAIAMSPDNYARMLRMKEPRERNH